MTTSKTAAQIVAEQRGISVREAVEFLKHTMEKEREKQVKKSPIDQIFDKLTAREHVILEALGFLNDESEYKGFAVHQLICGQIRNAQDELKEQYPRLKDLK